MRWIFVVMIVLLSFGSSAVAAEKQTDEKPRSGSGTEKLEPKERSGQQTTTKESAPKWPRPYKPSEEISVDSIVPFPVDI